MTNATIYDLAKYRTKLYTAFNCRVVAKPVKAKRKKRVTIKNSLKVDNNKGVNQYATFNK